MNVRQITKSKTNGRVYTPLFLVNSILDLSGYVGNNILCKHVIDNSCGDGAFLIEIVRRYCEESLKLKKDTETIKYELEFYIHGVELDEIECCKCINRLSELVEKYNIYFVDWDVICGNSLLLDKYNGKMDFVVGNPPYVRIHNIEDISTVKKYSFSQNGMTDLYIVFYELGLKMLNNTGVLGYITPSSFFNSLAGKIMRKYFVANKLIEKIVDLKHFQAFNATTYTAITILKKNHNSNNIDYYSFDNKYLLPKYEETLSTDDCYIAGNFYFSAKNNLILLKKILYNLGRCDIDVKNGYATLCDNVFINEFSFQSKHIIPLIKASKGEVKQAIYPYNQNGDLVSENELSNDIEVYTYLLNNKEALLSRSLENSSKSKWYSYGRSQAINDTFKNKLSLNTLIKTKDDLKIIKVPAGTGVYSGLYLLGDDLDLTKIKNALQSDEFFTYISLLGKYKSGGYYTFSSKDVKTFLDYKFAYYGGLWD